MENRNGKMVMTLLTGAAIGTAIGVGVGILFAPRKGRKTRRKIKHSKDELAKTAHDNKEAFEEKLEDVLSTMSYKAEDIITALEHKLEDIKKKNAQLQK